MNMFQLMDSDNESCGLVLTKLDNEKISELWQVFYQETEGDIDINIFIEECIKPIDNEAVRTYYEEINCFQI